MSSSSIRKLSEDSHLRPFLSTHFDANNYIRTYVMLPCTYLFSDLSHIHCDAGCLRHMKRLGHGSRPRSPCAGDDIISE